MPCRSLRKKREGGALGVRSRYRGLAMNQRPLRTVLVTLSLLAGEAFGCRERAPKPAEAPASRDPFVDFRGQQPGRVHKIRIDDLPPPNATSSFENRAHLVP